MAAVEIGVKVEVGREGNGQWYKGAGKAEEEWVEEHGDMRPELSVACLNRGRWK